MCVYSAGRKVFGILPKGERQHKKQVFKSRGGHDRDAGKHPNAGRVTAQRRSPDQLNRQPEVGSADQEQTTHLGKNPPPLIESCR